VRIWEPKEGVIQTMGAIFVRNNGAE